MNHVMGPEDEIQPTPVTVLTVPEFLKSVVGKSVGEAEKMATDVGLSTRIEKPTEARTMDFRLDRVNFQVKSGVVVSAEIG